jgi:hypothetical protein
VSSVAVAVHLTEDLLLHLLTHVASQHANAFRSRQTCISTVLEETGPPPRTSCIFHTHLHHRQPATPRHPWRSHLHQARDRSLPRARSLPGLAELPCPRTPVTGTKTQVPSSSLTRSSSLLCSTMPIETARLPQRHTRAGLQHHHRECATLWWTTGL